MPDYEDSVGHIPKYFLVDDFAAFKDLLLGIDHTECVFQKGDKLWKLDEYIEYNYYIESGMAKVEVVHESGHDRILWHVGAGVIFPGVHDLHFKIERSFQMTAVTEVVAYKFKRKALHDLVVNTPRLASKMIDYYAKMVNLGTYETAHQEYNDIFTSLCNLLYLLSRGKISRKGRILLSQQELADMLGVERANVSRGLSRLAKEGSIVPHRGWVELVDMDKIIDHCSSETLKG